MNYRNDILKVEMELTNKGPEIIKGTYHDIMDNLLKGKIWKKTTKSRD